MNKFFTKIAALSVGLAMAIGVGVAVGGNKARTASATMNVANDSYTYVKVESISSGDRILIVGNDKNYCLGTNNSNGNNRLAAPFDISTGVPTNTETLKAAMLTVGGNATDGYTLFDGDGYLVNNYYKSGSSNKNQLWTKDANTVAGYNTGCWHWDFTWTNHVLNISSRATIKNSTDPTAAQLALRLNYTVTDTQKPLFTCYANSTTNNTTPDLQIYKLSAYSEAKEFEDIYLLNPGQTSLPYPSPYTVPTGVSGTNCLSTTDGGLGYYDTAVAAYALLSDNAKIQFATHSDFAKARDRMIAWAAANGSSIEFNTTTGAIQTPSSRASLDLTLNDSNKGIIIVAVLSAVVLATVGGYFFIRKKKED